MSKIASQHSTLDLPNYDPSEITKFNVGASWWDLDGEFKLLHRINPLRLDYILYRAGGLFGKKVLDVGCGGGLLAESMAREKANVTGLDIGSEALAIARLHAVASGLVVEYRQQTVEEHALMYPSTYDVITCMEMLEHVPNPEVIVQACARLVKTSGTVFFSTLNRNPKSWLMAIIGAEYVMRILPKGTHDIMKFIKPAEILGWLDNTTLQEQNIIGLHYSLLQDRFYLGSNIDVNYILHTQRQT